eukprot:756898-Hanusia_phi.AAC.6
MGARGRAKKKEEEQLKSQILVNTGALGLAGRSFGISRVHQLACHVVSAFCFYLLIPVIRQVEDVKPGGAQNAGLPLLSPRFFAPLALFVALYVKVGPAPRGCTSDFSDSSPTTKKSRRGSVKHAYPLFRPCRSWMRPSTHFSSGALPKIPPREIASAAVGFLCYKVHLFLSYRPPPDLRQLPLLYESTKEVYASLDDAGEGLESGEYASAAGGV